MARRGRAARAPHRLEEPPPIGSFSDRAAIFDEALQRALAKEPDDRYATCRELAQALRRAALGSESSLPAVPPADPAGAGPAQVAPTVGRVAPTVGRVAATEQATEQAPAAEEPSRHDELAATATELELGVSESSDQLAVEPVEITEIGEIGDSESSDQLAVEPIEITEIGDSESSDQLAVEPIEITEIAVEPDGGATPDASREAPASGTVLDATPPIAEPAPDALPVRPDDRDAHRQAVARRRRVAAMAGGVLLLLAGLVVGWLVLGGGDEPQRSAAASTAGASGTTPDTAGPTTAATGPSSEAEPAASGSRAGLVGGPGDGHGAR